MASAPPGPSASPSPSPPRLDDRWREWLIWGCFVVLAVAAVAAGFGDDLSRLTGSQPAPPAKDALKAAGN